MRVLVVSQIFPNSAEPLSAPFNRLQLAALGTLCPVEVMATIPWYPGASLVKKSLAAVPDYERIDGLDVHHPRALYVPVVGRSLSAGLYASSLARQVWRRRHDVDVVLGTWAYPDGCAAIALGKMIGRPVVVKLHGSDINVVAQLPGPRAQIRSLLPRAARVVAVSTALADEAMALGVNRDRIRVVRNGVDTTRFFPRDRQQARETTAIPADARLVLYVGHLKESKGVLELARAFSALAERMPEAYLVVVGDGDARPTMQSQLEHLGDRAQLVGAQAHDRVADWMAASDLITLPSWNEGTPNVIIEALASGRRVIATDVGGIPDLIRSSVAGELVAAKDWQGLGVALERGLAYAYDPQQVADASPRSSWLDSAAQLMGVLSEAIG